jgi:hypothetical protein
MRQQRCGFMHLVAASPRGCVPVLLPLPLSKLPVIYEYYTRMDLSHCDGPIELNYKHRNTMHGPRRVRHWAPPSMTDSPKHRIGCPDAVDSYVSSGTSDIEFLEILAPHGSSIR